MYSFKAIFTKSGVVVYVSKELVHHLIVPGSYVS